jgi:hypothetical protein
MSREGRSIMVYDTDDLALIDAYLRIGESFVARVRAH